jgi:positive regulator of sigma E activity
MLINALFLYPSVFELNFWALSLFPVVNYVLLVISIYSVSAILNPFTSRNFTRIQVFTFANLVFLGSESLFSPQFLEMSLFSSAVLVHLWPILFFFLALGLLNKQTKASFGLIVLLGFMSGNSNIAESLFVQLSCVSILLLNKYQSIFFVELKRLYLFALSNLVGAITILSAPGFWARASEKNVQGIPDQFGEIAFRFAKSLAVFSADVLSHPMLLIFVIIGYKFSSDGGNFTKKFSNFGVLLFILLFASLVVGATIAYPAWHQSIGLVLLSPFVGMSIGDWLGSKKRISPKAGIAISSVAIFVVLISLTRAFWSIESRAQRWDSGFSQNYCAVLSSESVPLIGTETIYPISNLGIEDLNRWPWMRDAFTGWVTNSKFSAKDC